MSAYRAIDSQVDHVQETPTTQASDPDRQAHQQFSSATPVPGLAWQERAATAVPDRAVQRNVLPYLRRMALSRSAAPASESAGPHSGPHPQGHSAVIRRVAYATASQEFELSKKLFNMVDVFKDHNSAVDDEDSGLAEKLYTTMTQLCADPSKLSKLARWKRDDVPEFKGYVAADSFENLKVVTNCPAPLTADRVLLQIGRAWDNLDNKLKERYGESTGAAFAQYVEMHVQHYSNLRKQLGQEESKLGGLWKARIEDTSIDFETLNADSHGFAPPTALTLRVEGQKPAKFVHKSRPSQIDKLVTELFNAINKLIGSGRALPYYKQEVFNNGHLISEFIEGTQVDKKVQWMTGAASDEGLDALVPKQEVERRAQLVDQLKLLQLIAKKIGLTDLHEENLIYDPVTNMVVPIDLEAFDQGMGTGLYGHSQEPSLTWKDFRDDIQQCSTVIDQLILEFNVAKDFVERRLVPVPTGVLKNMLDGKGPTDKQAIIATSDAIKKFLVQRGFDVDEGGLGDYVGKCKVVSAIPLFTTIKGVVLTSELQGVKPQVIAKRK